MVLSMAWMELTLILMVHTKRLVLIFCLRRTFPPLNSKICSFLKKITFILIYKIWFYNEKKNKIYFFNYF